MQNYGESNLKYGFILKIINNKCHSVFLYLGISASDITKG